MQKTHNQLFLSPMTRLLLAFLLFVMILEVMWVYLAGFSVDMQPVYIKVAVMAVLSVVAWFYTVKRPDVGMRNVTLWLVVFLAIIGIAAIFSYLSTALNFPLMDGYFMSADLALGLDWVSYFRFASNHATLMSVFSFFYSITFPIFIFSIIFLAVTEREKTLERYMMSFVIVTLIVCLMCGFVPAVSPFVHLGLSASDFHGFKPAIIQEDARSFFLVDFHKVREGSLKYLSLAEMTGIVSFPSFHAVLTCIILFAFKGTGWLYNLAVFIVVVTLFAIPIIGGHYFVDVFAGMALTWFSWKMALNIEKYLEKNTYTTPLTSIQGIAV